MIMIIIIINWTIFIVLSSTTQSLHESSHRSSKWKSVSARWSPTRKPCCKLDIWVHLWAAEGWTFTRCHLYYYSAIGWHSFPQRTEGWVGLGTAVSGPSIALDRAAAEIEVEVSHEQVQLIDLCATSVAWWSCNSQNAFDVRVKLSFTYGWQTHT